MAEIDSQVGPYLNRLSDLLWTMARWQEGEHLLSAGRPGTSGPQEERPKKASRRREDKESQTYHDDSTATVGGRLRRRPERGGAAGRRPVTSVGIVVFEGDDGPRLADGVPDPVVIGARERARQPRRRSGERRGFKAKAGETLVALGAG